MAEILPFRGFRYNPKHVDNFDLVTSPPYDVIGPDLQDDLYRRSPHNVVRVDFGKAQPGDDDGENKYSRAARALESWLSEGILIQDREESIYYLEEDYQGEFGDIRTRKGFVARVRLEDPESGLYRPHEKTLAGPKADRLKLTKACKTNLSPIFSLYDDPTHIVQRDLELLPLAERPLMTVTADDGVVSRLWRVSAPELIRGVAATMHLKSFFIADGHHRYETSLNYRDLMRRETPGYTGKEPWNYVMMYFANLWAPGLTVFPTHRVVHGVPGLDLTRFLEEAQEYFEITEVQGGVEELLQALQAARADKHCFGLTAKGDPRLWLLELRSEGVMTRLLAGRAPKVLRTLDVTVLHSLILEELLGIDEKAQEAQKNLRYVKGSRELLRVVAEEEAQLGFLLNPTKVEEVKAVAEQGERMPQKSTFFYPKLLTGLVFNPLFDTGAPEE
ncbi:MAG: DUF1015 domain-containing protein [Deltaproteobacteria bacterium]|nr:DUF1015 domain-containing protein [Deltaproteobacteria bacterium]